MAEENTAYNWLDIGLDIYAKSAVDPAIAAVILPAAIALGAPGMTVWLAANAASLGSVKGSKPFSVDLYLADHAYPVLFFLSRVSSIICLK